MQIFRKLVIGAVSALVIGTGAGFAANAATPSIRSAGVVEDVRGPCDEAEHANDPQCQGMQEPEDRDADDARREDRREDRRGDDDRDVNDDDQDVDDDDQDVDDDSGPSENSGPSGNSGPSESAGPGSDDSGHEANGSGHRGRSDHDGDDD